MQRNILQGIQLQIFSVVLGNSFRLVPGPAEGTGETPGALPALAAGDLPLDKAQMHPGGGSVPPHSSNGRQHTPVAWRDALCREFSMKGL